MDVRIDQDASWGLDEEIEQTEHMARIWERQAELAQGTPSAEVIKSVALGYRLQLTALLESRARGVANSSLREG
ncbi:MAG TPA: hypothetical protein VNS11_07495 [Sphingomicrobium sp.]|nr:hypothetical protein [Sphingomicrobium sp.]